MALYFKSIYSAEGLSAQMANDHYKGQNPHILNKEEKKKMKSSNPACQMTPL